MAESTKPYVPGAIVRGELYTLQELKQRLKLGTHALRQARRQGLLVRKMGRRCYVLGEDVISFVTSDSRKEADHE